MHQESSSPHGEYSPMNGRPVRWHSASPHEWASQRQCIGGNSCNIVIHANSPHLQSFVHEDPSTWSAAFALNGTNDWILFPPRLSSLNSIRRAARCYDFKTNFFFFLPVCRLPAKWRLGGPKPGNQPPPCQNGAQYALR